MGTTDFSPSVWKAAEGLFWIQSNDISLKSFKTKQTCGWAKHKLLNGYLHHQFKVKVSSYYIILYHILIEQSPNPEGILLKTL